MKKIKINIKIVKILILVTILFIVGNGILLGVKAAAAAGVNYVTQSENITNPSPVNFLLVGTDLGGNRTFEEDGVRTDVQMVVSLVPTNERGNAEINVMNIPRDVTTEYACGGSGKINGAADIAARNEINAGNPDGAEQAAVDCTVDTVENMFDIGIDYYIVVNFDSFISIVDGIGGIDINNTKEFCEQDENGKADAYCFELGDIHLDGGAALSYARQRHESSDYERGQRQQLIMTKVFAKIMANPTQYVDNFAKTLISDTVNNLDIDLLLSLLNWASKTFNRTIEGISTGNPLYIDIKTSPFSNDTGFSIIDSLGDNIGQYEAGIYPIYDLYSSYDTIEQSTNINRYMLTSNSLGLPTSNTETDTNISNTVEIQFISLYVHEENTSTGFYSYVDDYTATYVNNQFDVSTGNDNTITDAETEF